MTEIPEYIQWQSHRDPGKIEEQLIYHFHNNQNIVSRVVGLLSMYFFDGWSLKKRQALVDIIREYADIFEAKITHYKESGNISYKAYSYEGLTKYLNSQLKTGDNDDFYCHIAGINPNENEDPSLWRVFGFGFARINKTRRLSGMEFHFPPAFILENPDKFVNTVCRWSESLEVAHGSGGLGVLTEPGRETVGKVYYHPLLWRYPALEYDNMRDYWSETQFSGYELPRSSNWLTIIDERNIEQLGGEDAIRSQLTSELYFERYANGCLIRAGTAPAIDCNGAGGVPQAYKDAARIIKSIRFEAYEDAIIEVPPELDGLDETLKWIRRFD